MLARGGLPIALALLAAASARAGGAIQWTQMPQTTPWSSGVGWNSLHYDTLKHRILFMGIEPNEGDDIYAHTLWAYDAAANQMTRLGGGLDSAGQLISQDTCPAGFNLPGGPSADDSPTWPGPRHPYHQMAWDSKRNRLWLMGGVCDGYAYSDTYFYDSAAEAWTQLQPAHYPTYRISMAMVYDSDTDALFLYGYDGGASTHDSWIYCPTDGSGTLSAARTAAGCVADDWVEVPLVNGTVNVSGTDVTWVSGTPFDTAWDIGYIYLGAPGQGTNYPVTSVTDASHLILGLGPGTQTGIPYHVQPPGWTQPGMAYDPVIHKTLLYGGGANDIWTYDTPTSQWTELHPANPPPNDLFFPDPALAYDRNAELLLYHQRVSEGAPQDWSYDPIGNRWGVIATDGGWFVSDAGAELSPLSTAQVMTYDPGNDVLVTWGEGDVVWQGKLGASLEPPDAGATDAGTAAAGPGDGGTAAAGAPGADGGARSADGGAPDAGAKSAAPSGCGCGASSAAPVWAAGLFAAVLARRRRRAKLSC